MLENYKTATLDVVLVSPWLPQEVQAAKHIWAEQPSSSHHPRKHRKIQRSFLKETEVFSTRKLSKSYIFLRICATIQLCQFWGV